MAGRGKTISKKGYLLQTCWYDSSPEYQQSNQYINLPGCCSHVPPLLLLLKEYKVSIVSFLYHMIELMNGMCTQYVPGLSIWGLCTKPVTASAEATMKDHMLSTNTAVRPAQFWEWTIYRYEPLNSCMIPCDETKLHLRKQKACLLYK